jgi:hypothetical protein
MNPKFYSGMTSSKYASDTRTIPALHARNVLRIYNISSPCAR